jgi:hypothetical protein
MCGVTQDGCRHLVRGMIHRLRHDGRGQQQKTGKEIPHRRFLAGDRTEQKKKAGSELPAFLKS